MTTPTRAELADALRGLLARPNSANARIRARRLLIAHDRQPAPVPQPEPEGNGFDWIDTTPPEDDWAEGYTAQEHRRALDKLRADLK